MKENNSQEFKPIKGILISSGCLGLYDNKRNDISLISLETDATVCGYFTQNIYRSATVVISENNIKDNPPKYIIVKICSTRRYPLTKILALGKEQKIQRMMYLLQH